MDGGCNRRPEAAALLKAKDFKGAEEAYRAALVERPNSGFGLYGLAFVIVPPRTSQ